MGSSEFGSTDMTVWIVVSILLVVLSPLAWLRPSRSQSGRMALRMEARRLGLAMQLTPQDWPHWLLQQPPNPCAQYHRARRGSRPAVWSYWQKAPGVWVNQWQETCRDESLLNHFRTLPDNVYKVEADRQMIALYWGEKGEASVLQDISAVLKALA
jgi:hypothetical protein